MTATAIEPIFTLRQYADREHQRLAMKYPDVPRSEIADLYPVDGLVIKVGWWEQVVAAVENGVLPSTRLWRSLTDTQQHTLLRTTRALRDDEFTHALIARSHVHHAGSEHGGPATADPGKVTCPDCKADQP